ncbi:hypothetical protein [Citrobacter youngae]|uniref:Uncharacterized protein n=1 Tax=Citrobacter youngae ATCC 29220 TaxID=500640 RepID=D4B8W9_9ENTR|nr:hypothetical protein [Citrobacter youngae]EFE09631.1 hypothetical protein CIT292_06907 [Citrobacter youngae ATCC 29220]
MSAPEQRSTVTPSPQDHEPESNTAAENGPQIPPSWTLSPEQRAFIDLFTDDEQKQ